MLIILHKTDCLPIVTNRLLHIFSFIYILNTIFFHFLYWKKSLSTLPIIS